MFRKGVARALTGLVAAGVVVTVVATHAAGTQSAFEAQVVEVKRPAVVKTFPTVDYGATTAPEDDRQGKTRWRVVNGTGNCCENFLTVTRGGRLLDHGGSYVHYTDDRGLTWYQVRSTVPFVNGEGAIVVAPNGDIASVEWDPYSGDRLVAFKYTAANGKWYFNELPLHTPFYDREWIGVVPGPIVIDGQTLPYVTFVKGAWPSKELWLYSTDALNYVEAKSKFVDQTLNGRKIEWLKTYANSTFDWIQPNSNTGMTPLGPRRILAAPDYPTTEWSILDHDRFTFYGFRFPNAAGTGDRPVGRYQVDSAGRIHNVVNNGASFDYRISTDGGQTWNTVNVALPEGWRIELWDFRANRQAGVAAVAIHADKPNTENDQDLLYKFAIGTNQPRLLRQYTLGLGDAASQAGVGNSVRMDFQTVAIFRDGRVGVSFIDSTTKWPSPTTGLQQTRPALAVELRTILP